MLMEGAGLKLDRGRLASKFPQVEKALVAAISKAAAASGPEASTFRQPRLSGGFDVISVIGSPSLGRRSVTVCISAPKATDGTLMSRLRALYGLAQAEAEVALGIAAGASVSELAHERGTSVGTVRIQVKAIASKLGCSRQAEIAAIVNSIPRFFGC
jgi:DNA-binding CsgD family transcriptional regulator